MSVADSGFEIQENLLSPVRVDALLAALSTLKLAPLRGGIRRIEQQLPQIAELAHSSTMLSTAAKYLRGKPELVRAIYFDKSPENNWLVTWHQDRTVAVSSRFEVTGWGPWSLKAGVWHVQPPLEVLQDMVTIRVHLDAATTSNGCLKVIPGSHELGLFASEDLLANLDQSRVVYCEVAAGDAVIMRPQIFHASEKSVTDTPRRVLHFEYSSYSLPQGIAWSP